MKFFLSVFILSCINIACFAKTISPNLTAEYNSRKKNVSIKWQNTDDRATRFILQRSDDNNKWKDIYVLESSNFSNKKLEKYSDESPATAKNYYRLKMVLNDNSNEYSLSAILQTAGRCFPFL